MANRRFEMYQYRQILSRMRLGDLISAERGWAELTS